MDWGAFAWVSGGLIIYGLLIRRAGFIVSSVVLFVCGIIAGSFRFAALGGQCRCRAGAGCRHLRRIQPRLGLNLPKGIWKVPLMGSSGLSGCRICRGDDASQSDVGADWRDARNGRGVLPGIGPAVAIALLPDHIKIDPAGALIMFAGIYYAMYGGSDPLRSGTQ